MSLAMGLPGSGQSSPGLQRPVYTQPLGQGANGEGGPLGGDPLEEEKILRAQNAQRQRSLVADTDRLLRLASELNAQVASTNPASLTAEQLRKVAEIEKLARNVKDKMSTSVRGTPGYLQPQFPVR